jgi:hypothetical protein
MKPFLTFLTLLLLGNTVFSQNTYYQVDSMLITGLSKTVYLYDDAHRLETSNSFSYDYDLDSIMLNSKSDYFYNSNGQLIEVIEQNYDYIMDVWSNFKRTVHHYNGTQKSATVNYSFSSEWEYEDSTTLLYDGNDFLVLDTTYYYDGMNWQYDQYTSYERFLTGQIQADTTRVFNTGAGMWEYNRLTTYQYSDDLLTNEEKFGWNTDSLAWYPQDKSSYEYDQYDYLSATINYDTDSEDSWVPFMKTEVYYDYSVSPGQMNYPENGDMDAFIDVPKIDSAGIFSWQDSVWSESYMPVYFYYSTYMSVYDDQLKNVQIYPNPVSTNLYLETAQACIFQVFDVNGKYVMDGKLTDEASTINVSQLEPGMYLLQISSENSKARQFRFVKY